MQVEVEEQGGVTVVRLAGDLTAASDHEVMNRVLRLLDRERARVVLDLGGVPLISSDGLGVLVRLTAQANSQDCRLVLAQPTPFVSGVLEVTRLNRFFEVFPDVASAVGAMS